MCFGAYIGIFMCIFYTDGFAGFHSGFNGGIAAEPLPRRGNQGAAGDAGEGAGQSRGDCKTCVDRGAPPAPAGLAP